MEYRRYFWKETVVFTLILLLLCLFIQGLALVSHSRILWILFDNPGSVFYTFKAYFFALSLFIVGEYFIVFRMPNNYLLSRVAGGSVFFTVSALFLALYERIGIGPMNVWLYLLIETVSIYSGQLISYLFQRRTPIRLAFYLGFFEYMALLAIVIVFTFINIL